jgi:integrase
VYQRGPRNWWIKWREGGRIRYKGGFESPELAEQIRAKIVGDIAAGRAGLPQDEPNAPTLADLADAWLERRTLTTRSVRFDKLRWKNHLRPFFGGTKPKEIDSARLRAFVEAKLAAGLNPATIVRCLHLLSAFYEDLLERGIAQINPVRALPRSTRRLLRSTYDTSSTPFLESLSHVRQVFRALQEPTSVAFGIGAFAGLRTAEILGLEWRDVNLSTRRIHVRRQVNQGRLAVLKDDESRIVPIVKALLPLLAQWRLRRPGEGLLFPPAVPKRGGKVGTPPTFMRPHTLHKHLRKAVAASGLSRLTWYQATRHTFASQWVLGGGSIEKLKELMGHSSVIVTERYAHLRPDLFRSRDFDMLDVDLMAEVGEVVPLTREAAETGAIGYAVVTGGPSASEERLVIT